MEWLIVVVSIGAGLISAVLLFWLIAMIPRIIRKPDWKEIPRFDYAHRGFYHKNQSVPENSLGAFCAAAERGFGIELDIQLTSDGKVVVFHDQTLKRLCGDERKLGDVPWSELKEIPLMGTQERIPLFSDVLKAVGGRVPLIVEFKYYNRTEELCEKACVLLKDYKGTWCMESFHPSLVAWFRKNRPEVVRGQLMQNYKGSKELSPIVGFLATNLCSNIFTAPDFIAYRVKDRQDVSLRVCRKLYGVQEVDWTIHSLEELNTMKADGAIGIFEHFDPQDGGREY